jgi:hypothetical protein
MREIIKMQALNLTPQDPSFVRVGVEEDIGIITPETNCYLGS